MEKLKTRNSGHESLAARVLSSWGRPQDKSHIKSWFTKRMLDRKIKFRTDLIEVFSCFRDDDDIAYIIDVFRKNPSARSTLGFILRDLPQSRELSRSLIEYGDPQLSADTIDDLMWSRKIYGRSLRVLAKNSNESISAAAQKRLALFERFPRDYD